MRGFQPHDVRATPCRGSGNQNAKPNRMGEANTDIAHPFHQTLPLWCHQSALDPVKVAEPVQIRPREPFSNSCTRQRDQPLRCNRRLLGASPRCMSTFQKRIRGSQQTRSAWDRETPGAAPGCPTISSFILHLFIPPCSSTAEHRTLTPNVPVRLRSGLSTFHSWKSNRTTAPERS